MQALDNNTNINTWTLFPLKNRQAKLNKNLPVRIGISPTLACTDVLCAAFLDTMSLYSALKKIF